jgi:hypothetical protein
MEVEMGADALWNGWIWGMDPSPMRMLGWESVMEQSIVSLPIGASSAQ